MFWTGFVQRLRQNSRGMQWHTFGRDFRPKVRDVSPVISILKSTGTSEKIVILWHNFMWLTCDSLQATNENVAHRWEMRPKSARMYFLLLIDRSRWDLSAKPSNSLDWCVVRTWNASALRFAQLCNFSTIYCTEIQAVQSDTSDISMSMMTSESHSSAELFNS